MSRLIFLVPYVVFLAILLSQADFVPLWDAWIYAECAANVPLEPGRIHSYACAGHLSHAYIALLAVPSLLGCKQQMWHLLAVNALLGCVAIRSGISIVQSMSPAHEYRSETWMAGLLMAVHPQLLASAVFVNVDCCCRFLLCLLGVPDVT